MSGQTRWKQAGASWHATLVLALATVVGLVVTPPAQAVSRIYYVHNDHLGTPQALTDENGAVVWQADYEPFGRATETTALISQPVRLPGQYFDKETELHQNWHRSYNPRTGRYLKSDPIGLVGGLNTYVYTNNTPLVHIDPLGLFCFTTAQINVIAATGGGVIAGFTFDGYLGALVGGILGGIPAAAAQIAPGDLGNIAGLTSGAVAGFLAPSHGGGGRAAGGVIGVLTAGLSGSVVSKDYPGASAGGLGGAVGGFAGDILFGVSKGGGFGPISSGLRGGAVGLIAGLSEDLLRDWLKQFECKNDCDK